MSFVPYAVQWVLLVAAAVSYIPAGWRARIHLAVSLAASLLSLALWFLFRPDVVSPALAFAGRQWAIGQAAWPLTGAVLLLTLLAAVRPFLDRHSLSAPRQSALLFMLAAAALPPIWAADDRTRLLGLAFFAAGWVVASRVGAPPDKPSWFDILTAGRPLLAALLLVWLAAALPTGRLLFGMLGGAALLGLWPLARRAAGDEAALLPGSFAVLVGGAVLAATIAPAAPAPLEIAAGTALGLISLVAGLAVAWSHAGSQTPDGTAAALRLGLAGLALVAAIWAGPEALLAGVRLAVFAPLLLALGAASVTPGVNDPSTPLLSEPDGRSRGRFSPGWLVVAAVYLVLAGLPLSVGFVTLSSLYSAWRASGGWVLILVTVLLMTLWLAAVARRGRTLARSEPDNRAGWLRASIFILPAIGLLSPSFALPAGGWPVWLALAVPALAGVLLGRFLPVSEPWGEAMRDAAALPPVVGQLAPRLHRARAFMAGALADALAILEGDYGLLWLLGLLLLLVWIA